MLNIFIKLLVSKLNNLFVLVALTGFVCTYKIQAEEECLSSNVLCYECDSRYDPNCADPFELSSLSLIDQQAALAARTNPALAPANATTPHDHQHHASGHVQAGPTELGPGGANNNNDRLQQQQQQMGDGPNRNATSLMMMMMLKPRKPPNVVVCHGCCVKITSKTPEGLTYVKRTCTTNLQINYFMVGLVCMKESGDRGKMCFCETDYCNGQTGSMHAGPGATASLLGLLTLATLLATSRLMSQSHPTISL